MRRIKLYPHNLRAYEKTVRMLKTEGKAAIVHPTGTGKSFIAFALVRDNPDKNFLWLSPSEYIYDLQCKNLWQSQHMKLSNIDFHTYAWLMLNEDFIKELNPDYIIMDEFHRSGAHQWGKSVKKLIESYPKAKLLGLSATKVRYLDNRRDMAEEIFEGCIASEIGLCEAMALGILPEPKYVIASYSYEMKLQEYETRTSALKNRRQKAKAERLIEKLRHKLQYAEGMDKIFKKHLPKESAKLIIFCCSSEHMMEMIAQVPDWFNGIDIRPHVYHVSSYNPESEEDFKNFVADDSDHLKLLYCIDMLNEGIHVDDVDAVVLCRPTVSPIVYKQQIGRAIAVGSKRKPVIFDMVNNFDSLSQINDLKQELEGAIEKYNNEGCGYKEENEKDGICDIGGFEIVDELRDCRLILEQIQRNLDASWDIYYQELCRFTEEHGTCTVPKRYRTADGLLLGRWFLRQKGMYREGRLSPEHTAALEKLGIVWEYENEMAFARNVEFLKEYKKKHGTMVILRKRTTPEIRTLGRWCTNVRIAYKQGRLPEERINILNELGFCWDALEDMWEEGYRHAQQYYEENGELNAIRKYVCEDGYRLGQWLATQRSVRRGRTSGNLTEEKIKKMDELSMDWSGKGLDYFERYFAVYKKYISEGGSRIIPFRFKTTDGVNLGVWDSRVRSEYYRGVLPKSKEQRLRNAGYSFRRYSYTWYKHYEEAKKYYETYGDLYIKQAYIRQHGGALNHWINVQRKRMLEHNCLLDEEQIRLLKEIHIGDCGALEAEFNKGTEELKRYIEQFGNTLVPVSYKTPEGYNLGKWVGHRKTEYKRGELSKAKTKALNKLGMVWESTETVRAQEHWKTMYKAAVKYAEEHGSLKNLPSGYVTDNGEKLSLWVAQQRRIRKGSIKHSIKMTEERIAMLDKIGINWGEAGNRQLRKIQFDKK